MSTTIYLIRHGEVENPQGIIYGRMPHFGLSERGKLEIQKTAEFLKDKKISQVYSSPLLRTKETAEIIAEELHIPEIHFSDDLLEVKTSYQGRKFSELDELQSEVYLKPLSPDDETIEQLAKRMKFFIDTVLKSHSGEHIVACGHGDPIMAIKAVIGGKPLEFRVFKTNNYIQHGEALEIISDDINTLSIKSVFKPTISASS